MPELPDLEIIREVLRPRLSGQTITDVEVIRPLVVRDLTGQGFAETVVGQVFADVQRRGKLLLFSLSSGLTLAGMAEKALADAVAKMEKKAGKPFPKRKHELRGGRPMK